MRLLIAFGEVLLSHSAILCYFAMVLNTLMSGSIISLMFPLSIFFWALLSVPMPKKSYWVTVITYTEVCVTYLWYAWHFCGFYSSCVVYCGWLGSVVVSVSDSRSRGPGFDSRPLHRQATTLGKLLTPMCLCHQAVQFGTGQRAVMLCGREGNRGSGVTLAMRHRLLWFIHIWAHGQGKEDEHPTYTHSVMVLFTFFSIVCLRALVFLPSLCYL